MKKPLLISLLLAAAFSACAAPRRPPAKRPGPTPVATPAPEAAAPAEKPARIAVIFTVHPEGDPETILQTLEADPGLKLTLMFPPAYFDSPERARFAQRFAVLQSSGQVEVVLSLDNEPILPLLTDLRLAGDKVQKWGFGFAWPEDAAAQVARASGRYRKRWGRLPSGFHPPYGAASESVMQVLRRFRLNWVMARAGDPWGVKFFGGTALIVPPSYAAPDETSDIATSARRMAQLALTQPFIHVVSGDWPTPEFDRRFLAELGKARAGAPAPLGTASEFVEGLRREYELPDSADPFENDYSAWVQSPLQKRAWQALAEARQVIENYKNSGRANLNRLDAAIEEMSTAESGPFLLSLGSEQASTASFGQRNFLATLANIYRLAGVPVPPNLSNWFADRSWHRTQSRPTDQDRPFFVDGPSRIAWNDPKGDDTGSGAYVYPAGNYPKGSFDLRDLTVSWSESEVKFSAGIIDLPAAGSVSVMPMVDVYIDVNRLSEAGSTAVLGRRGQAVIERDAAWEYAVVLGPKTAAIYQGLPGGEQRLLMTKPTTVTKDTFSVGVSRKVLRGEPRQWRLTVAAGGTEVTPREEPPLPIAVQATASQKAFGGAPGPRMPPRYVDLLAPGTDVQANRLSAYATGTVILPFVEAE